MAAEQDAVKQCAICSGSLDPARVSHEELRDKRLYVFSNVPAEVCLQCGEIWISERTLAEIDRLVREGRPSQMIETPVFDLGMMEAA